MEKFENIDDFWKTFLNIGSNKGNTLPILFRGVTNNSHQLIPSIGRETKENTGGEIRTLEDSMIREFKRLSTPVISEEPRNEFEWLFLAQHYGLPTRLLDWSSNPLVALYFAVERNDEIDGAFYFVEHQFTDQYELFDYKTADYTKEHRKKPTSCIAITNGQGNYIFVRPKYTDQRYLNQKSVFSCPKDPYKPMTLSEPNILHIKGYWKHELRCRLRRMGIATSFIYPGLSGIATEVKSLEFDQIQKVKMKLLSSVISIDI